MKPVTVYVDDNYHYMDKDYRTKLGDFVSPESAVNACKRIVDEFLESNYTDGMTAEDLYAQYTTFGEDPFVSGPGAKGVLFSAWTYAKERARIICDQAVKEAQDRVQKLL